MDDPDTIRRFISQINGRREHFNIMTVTSQPTTQHDQVARTPLRTTLADQEHEHLTSPEAHPKPSPHISGLKAPQNTPKTAASSPRLAAASTLNQDVAEALSDYVNTMDGRPLSDSMWAPGSTRYKPSMLSEARYSSLLTPIKAVQPNPAINDTFDRMSFKAADPNHKVGENLIGDRITQTLFSKAPPSFVNEFSLLADNVRADKVDGVQAKPETASDEDFEPPDTIKEVRYKTDRASKKDVETPAHTDTVEKESDAPSTSEAYVPPHLRATRASSQKSDSSTRVPAQNLSESSPPESSPAPPFSVPNPASSEFTVKAETNLLSPEGLSPDVKSKNADPDLGKDAVRAATNGVELKVITGPAGVKPPKGASEGEDLEHKTFFNAWPKLEERGKPAAKVRTVIIKDLPRGSTATFVASLVYGGPVEEIYIRPSAAGDVSAVIRFMDAGDCMKFYDETSNGLVYEKDAKGRGLVLFVELSKDVDVVGGLLQGWIVSGVTRCVRAVGAEAEWGMDGLLKMAERKNRKVEKIVDGQNPGGARSVVFRFCRIEDAVQFKAALSRDEEWEHCNIHYAADPCAAASGVHFED